MDSLASPVVWSARLSYGGRSPHSACRYRCRACRIGGPNVPFGDVDTCCRNVGWDFDNLGSVDGVAPTHPHQPGASPSKKTTRPETKKPQLQRRLFVRPRPARFGKISWRGASAAAFGTSSAGRAGQTRHCSASCSPEVWLRSLVVSVRSRTRAPFAMCLRDCARYAIAKPKCTHARTQPTSGESSWMAW